MDIQAIYERQCGRVVKSVRRTIAASELFLRSDAK